MPESTRSRLFAPAGPPGALVPIRWRRVLLGGACTAALLFGAQSARAAEPADVPPARVTGASLLLDTVESGARVGVPTGSNMVLGTVLGTLPAEVTGDPNVAELINQISAATLDGGSALVDVVTTVMPELRTAIEPLAEANGSANVAVEAVAAVIEYGGQLADPLAPGLTLSATEVADLIRSFGEPQP